ncbi:MAG: hypothetical protein ACOX1Q_10675 [Eubacteriales bacterium]
MKKPKVYVDVIARFSTEGELYPMEIIWEDGRHFTIDRITEIRRASSLKAGGAGIRYGCIINNHRTFVFFEEDRWFVERKYE